MPDLRPAVAALAAVASVVCLPATATSAARRREDSTGGRARRRVVRRGVLAERRPRPGQGPDRVHARREVRGRRQDPAQQRGADPRAQGEARHAPRWRPHLGVERQEPQRQGGRGRPVHRRPRRRAGRRERQEEGRRDLPVRRLHVRRGVGAEAQWGHCVPEHPGLSDGLRRDDTRHHARRSHGSPGHGRGDHQGRPGPGGLDGQALRLPGRGRPGGDAARLPRRRRQERPAPGGDVPAPVLRPGPGRQPRKSEAGDRARLGPAPGRGDRLRGGRTDRRLEPDRPFAEPRWRRPAADPVRHRGAVRRRTPSRAR